MESERPPGPPIPGATLCRPRPGIRELGDSADARRAPNALWCLRDPRFGRWLWIASPDGWAYESSRSEEFDRLGVPEECRSRYKYWWVEADQLELGVDLTDLDAVKALLDA